jgi:hypothetical protein
MRYSCGPSFGFYSLSVIAIPWRRKTLGDGVRESALPVAIGQLDDWLKTCTENFKTQPSCFTPVAAETKIAAKKTETASSAQRPPSRRARKRRSRWADSPEAADRK